MHEKVMSQETKERSYDKNSKKYALAAFLAIIIFVILYKYSLNQLRVEGINDLKEHTLHAQNIYMNGLKEAWLKRPYLFWHLCVKGCIKFLAMPVEEAAAFCCAGFAVLNYFITFYLLNCTASKVLGCDTGMVSACAAGALGLVQPMYVYWFNSYQYEGQFSINPIFNPTHMAVKPIGLLCFMIGIDLIRSYKEEDSLYFSNRFSSKWLYVFFSVALFLSTFTKPTFMYMLLPAGALYLLVELVVTWKRKDGGYKKVWGIMWRMACAAIPSLLYLLLEYAAFYFWGGTNSDAHVAIYPFLTAWHIYSPNVPKSIILSMAFPFWILLTNWKYFLHSVEGKLSVIGYLVGILEFSFIVETGFKLSHLNFAWPMISGMLLLWVISAARLVYLTVAAKSGIWNKITVTVGWLLLSIHLFSGLYYINPYAYIL